MQVEETTVGAQDRAAVDAENIPSGLKSYSHWVVHLDKEPFDPKTGRRASTTDSRTWATFPEALEALDSGRFDGIGFVFSSGDPFVGIDLDNVRDPETGEISQRVREYVDRFEDAYIEISPSGAGLHIITRGRLFGGTKRGKFEIYGTGRFFTVTGEVL